MADNLKVQVAKDVIKNLDLFQMTHDGYIIVENSAAVLKSNDLEDITPYCHVCALGACYLSSLNIAGEGFRSVYDDEDVEDAGATIFGRDNAEKIESAYEKWSLWNHITADCDRYAPKQFGERFEDDHARLRAIMENVIENDGEFKP